MPVLSLSDFLWSLLIIFFMVTYFMMLFHVIVDIFRRKDTSGFTKAIWLLFLLIIPLFGLLAYLIVNGQGMEPGTWAAQESKAQFDDYVPVRLGRLGGRDRVGQAAARQRRHRPERVRPPEGQGARGLMPGERPAGEAPGRPDLAPRGRDGRSADRPGDPG